MILTDLVSRTQQHLAKRRHFNRLIAEIESLSPRDLADLRADRGEMIRHARKQVFG
jgi:hypothetical protein